MVPESSMLGAAGAAAGHAGPAGGTVPGLRTASSPGHGPGMMPGITHQAARTLWSARAGTDPGFSFLLTRLQPKSPPRL